MSSWRWFSVKTLFRSGVDGAAGIPTLVEERVVLLRARTHDEAIRSAERDAAAYVGPPFLNSAGQEVRMRYLGACTSYELMDEDASRLGGARGKIEAFSNTYLTAVDVADEELRARLLGGDIGDEEREQRWRTFVPGDLAARRAAP